MKPIKQTKWAIKNGREEYLSHYKHDVFTKHKEEIAIFNDEDTADTIMRELQTYGFCFLKLVKVIASTTYEIEG